MVRAAEDDLESWKRTVSAVEGGMSSKDAARLFSVGVMEV